MKIVLSQSYYQSTPNGFNTVGGDALISGNNIQGSVYGIYSDNTNIEVSNNTINTTSGWTIRVIGDDGSSIIKHNLLETNSGRAFEVEEQTELEFINNTLIGTESSDYAIYSNNYSTPIIRNNIIYGFQNAIYIENNFINYNISYNNLWQISNNLFEGTAMPALIGNMISQNLNGDLSDIYYNISMDPLFVNQEDSDYNLLPDSPCINAGLPVILDPDETISDIGTHYYDNPPEVDPPGPGPSFTVSGSAYLSSESDHSGIQVLFYNLVSEQDEDFTITNSDGSYNLDISPGLYSVVWSKEGYVPYGIDLLPISEDIILDDAILFAGSLQNISGTVSGNWSTGNVFSYR